MMIELRDPRGRVIQRVAVGRDPVRVGRALDNDLIVDDPYVEGHHAVLVLSEQGVVVEDLGSTNGTNVAGNRLEGRSQPVVDGTAIVIGRTRIVVRNPESPVAPARRLGSRLTRALTSRPGLPWGLAVASLVWLGIWIYSDSYQKIEGADFAFAAIGFALIILMWTGAWALGGRLFGNRSNFRAHMGFVALVILISAPISGLWAYAPQLFPKTAVVGWIGTIASAVLFWPLFLFGHIDIASQRPRRTKMAITGGVCLVLVGLTVAVSTLDDAHNADVRSAVSALKPTPEWLTRRSSSERFLADLADLENQLDEEALDVEIDDPPASEENGDLIP